MSNPDQTYNGFVAQLKQVGLNLCASFNLHELPQAVDESLPENLSRNYKSLLLVGNRGGEFWQYLQTINEKPDHPFNTISQKVTEKILQKTYPQVETLCLYPSNEYILPLQKLGHRVGWGRPSILGLDIHPQYGTWFAYRTAFLVSESLPQTTISKVPAVCEECIDKPCQAACPVQAVRSFGHFDIMACSDNRVKEKSVCANQCLSRLACPVGREYRYSSEQLVHHGSFSLASIKRYKESNKW